MIKSITNFLIIFFIFQQLKSQISQIDQNGVKPFCDETLHMLAQVPWWRECYLKLLPQAKKVRTWYSLERKNG